MKKIVSIFKNKEVMNRIFFTIMILLVIRIGAAITIPGVSVSEDLQNEMQNAGAIGLMDLLGGGALLEIDGAEAVDDVQMDYGVQRFVASMAEGA